VITISSFHDIEIERVREIEKARERWREGKAEKK
jgi:hypothetical protein